MAPTDQATIANANTETNNDDATVASTLYWSPNTLVLPLGSGLVRLFQVTTRRNVLATVEIVPLIDRLVGGRSRGEAERDYAALDGRLRIVDATAFSLWDHAYSNSDFLDTTVGEEDLEALPFDEFVEVLEEAAILSPCWPPRIEMEKKTFGDRFKGNFYEQVGTESLFERTTPTEWWTRQKFTADLSECRPTPYKFIEERFLERYFAEHLGGTTVLEIGSGTGYFTRKLAEHAEIAIGMDYNEDYVAAARRSWPAADHPNLEFHVGDILDLSRNAEVFGRSRFDRVVLIDTFLFLFDDSYQNQLYQQREQAVRNMATLMADDGRMLIMDPHPLWLTPWFGQADRPFGILTEYRERSFKVIPSLEEMTGLLCDCGLRIRRILEPPIDAEYAKIDPRAHAFMERVPQWCFYEVEKARGT